MRAPWLIALVALTACTTTTPESTVGTTAPSTFVPATVSTVVTSTASPPSTQTTLPSVSSPTQVGAADLGDRRLEWRPTDQTVSRLGMTALFTIGDTLFIGNWNAMEGLRIWKSSDGETWVGPQIATGIPPGWNPTPRWEWEGWITGGRAGAVSVGDISGEDSWKSIVLTSSDGLNWVAHDFGQEIVASAVGDRLLVVGETGRLWISDGTGGWTEDVSPAAEAADQAAVAVDGRFLIARTTSVVAVDADDAISMVPPPSVQVGRYSHASPWKDGLVMVGQGDFGLGFAVSVIATEDGRSWLEFPAPHLGPQSSEAYWSVYSMTAGTRGVTLGAVFPGEHFDFRGEAFQAIPFEAGPMNGGVFGDRVFTWDPISITATVDQDGTLTIRELGTSRVLTVLNCDRLRSAARDLDFLGGSLVGWPRQMIEWSPDGAAWDEQKTADLFGNDAFVHQLLAFGDRVVALVAPNGDQPIPDPPNCRLGLYPDALPYEIWIGTPSG